MSTQPLRPYQALISKPGSDSIDARAEVMAISLDDARAKLEVEYGAGSVYSLWNEEDASRPRQANYALKRTVREEVSGAIPRCGPHGRLA
jgi:hypothetical protein